MQATDANLRARGAYVLQEAKRGERQVTLLATGSEVALALAARELLQSTGSPTAVVSEFPASHSYLEGQKQQLQPTSLPDG